MTDAVMIKTIYLKATPETVWAYLTEKNLIARWFYETECDLSAGASFRWLSHHLDRPDRRMMSGKVVTFEPPQTLVHTFTHGALDDTVTTVTWDLAAIDGGTQLTLTHAGLVPFDMLTGHDEGWDTYLSRLRSMIN